MEFTEEFCFPQRVELNIYPNFFRNFVVFYKKILYFMWKVV